MLLLGFQLVRRLLPLGKSVCIALIPALFWGRPSLAAENQPAAPLDAATLEFVNTKIKPLLESRCFECHSGKAAEPKGGLRLDSLEAILKGGESGAVVKPGHPEKSPLIDAINYRGDYEMPPASKMPPGEIALLTRWVELGAPWPAGGEPPLLPAKSPFPLQQRKAAHWSWRPVKDPPPPTVRQQDWARRDLDRFILARLEQAGLKPAADTDRRTLLRRVWFDIVGLPPSPADVESFVADPAPTHQALEKVVDRLLASPHFGERWGRHWLDLMRYAESRGHEYDFSAPNAWQYRDYVIRALNADLPYNQFVTEHVAGDLIVPPRLNPETKANESILATGFWYLGDWVHSPVDIRRDETDRIDNQIDTLSRAFLGLTVACARCHDHKFDAISTKDYYALAGFARSSSYRQAPFESLEQNRLVANELWAARAKADGAIRAALVDALRPSVKQTADYLTAAVATTRGRPPSAPPALDAKRLQAWVAALQAAEKNPQSPLHGFLQRLQSPSQASSGAPPATTSPSAATPGWRITVDYGQLAEKDWVQSGVAFGPGPRPVGSLLLAENGQSVSGVSVLGAAVRDGTFSGLGIAPGTEAEPAEAARFPRHGQMLRTPTFTNDSGTLHYLVRGNGIVLAAVGEHRMLYSLLHDQLILSFNVPGDQPRWVTHPLQRYKGLRTHIEFMPADGGSFEVLAVADGRTAPPLPQPGRKLLHEALSRSPDPNQDGAVRRLVGALETLLIGVVDRLATGGISHGPEPQETARWADWMVRHPELFVPDPDAASRLTAEIQKLRDEEKRLATQVRKSSRMAIAVLDGVGEDEELLVRGNSSTPHGRVPRRFLEALVGSDAPSYPRGSGRLELAKQLTEPANNPFVSRVLVNRVWHHLMGRGIVPTVDDFGVMGQPPSHPELLDHLATRFAADGWSIKRLIRQVVTSRAYQMSSRPADAAAEAADPDNVLLHRMNLRRLEGEIIRDAILAVSGRLDRKIEGAPVPIHLTAFMTGRGRPKNGPLDGAGRRSIYLSVRRNFLSPLMLSFDMPVPSVAVGRRNVSNVPAQPLILLNDPFVVEQARRWADRALADPAVSPESRIKAMYEAALGRPAELEETQRAEAFLKQQSTAYGIAADGWQKDPRPWADLGHVIWNMKEFIFID